MKTLDRILKNIFSKLTNISKPQKDFLIDLFEVVFSKSGRGNFTNFARFSSYNECSFRRNFEKYFDWVSFNWLLISLYFNCTEIIIAAVDCSFIPKSGKKTYGLDKFWSSCLQKALKGLEVSLLCLINTNTGAAWVLDVCQTPPGLAQAEGKTNNYTRVNFYIEQILDCIQQLSNVLYITADGFYAKKKVFLAVPGCGKHLITKLRNDANLRFLYSGENRKGQRGSKRKYAGKVFYNDLSNWLFEGIDYHQNYLHIYYQTLNSPRFGIDLKVVLILNTKTNQYILLASTDIFQPARQILDYYRLRFQIEFLFRDAKQFTCLNHCQARSEAKLDFHFNMSLTAVNLVRAVMTDEDTSSINNFVRESYNSKFLKFIYLQLSFLPEFELNTDIENAIIQYGCMRA